MKTRNLVVVTAIVFLMVLPGLVQARPTGAPGRSGGLPTTPLAGCTVSLTASPTGAVDVNQTVSFTATLSSACTSGTGNYAYFWRNLPANCTAPSTYPTTITSPSLTVSCHPRYDGNFTMAQAATYYDYVYNTSVTANACSLPGCGAPGDPAFVAGSYLSYEVYGEPRLLASAGGYSLAAEVGVTKTISTYFPLGAVGIDQTLARKWVLRNASAGASPGAMGYDGITGQIFITNGGSGYNVSAFSVNEGLVTTTIAVGSDPRDVVVADGKVFVSNSASNNISIINPRTDKVMGSVSSVTNASGMTYDAINGYLYVADGSPGSCLLGSSLVTVINATSDSIVGSIHIPGISPTHMGYDPSTHEIYVTNDYSCSTGSYGANVSAIYTAPGTVGTVVSVINVGTFPSAVGYSPVSHDIYVTNELSSTVTVIRDSTNAIVKTFGVGRYPTGITTWPKDEGHLFMSNIGSANMTVINTTTNSVQFNFGNTGLDYAADIVDYGDLALTNLMTGNVVTILFQNSTIPEYGSGLFATPPGTQGRIGWYSNDSAAVPVFNCMTTIPNRFCAIDPVKPGNFTLQAQPTDTNGGDSYFGATNVTFSVRVYPRLQAGPLVSNHSTQGQLLADAGIPVALKVGVTNGTGPGTYASKWSGLPSGCATLNATQISCTPKAIGHYNVTATVRDALGGSLTRTNALVVYPNPRIAILSASNRSAHTNETLFVSSEVTGGAPPYRFCVSDAQFTDCAPETVTNSTYLSYAIDQAGNYSMNVSVTDSAGVTRNYSFTEQMSYLPRLVNLAGPAEVDAGQNVTFTAQLPPGYGIPPLNVTWEDASTQQLLCAPQTFSTSNVTSRCTFAPSSSVAILVTVSDSRGASWNTYAALNVHPDPAISLEPIAGLAGKAIPVMVHLSGGISPYRVCLTTTGTACVVVSTTTALFNVTYPAAGSYPIRATVNDSSGRNVSTTEFVAVYSPMSVSPIKATWDPLDTLAQDSFNTTVTGGSPTFSTWWNETGRGPLCSGFTMTVCTAPLAGSGKVTVSVSIRDSIGDNLTLNTSITIDPQLSVQLPTSTLTANQQGWLNGSISGGTAPYSWSLTGTPGSPITGSAGAVALQTVFASPGNYTLYFQVSDQGGGRSSSLWEVSVLPATSPTLTAPCAPTGPTGLHPMQNGTYAISCVTGGSLPYTYAWIWADSTVTQGNATATHRYEGPGHYNVTVMVKDATGAVAFAQPLQVLVTGPSVQGPPTVPCSPTGPASLALHATGAYAISCVTGGLEPYSYSWEWSDGTISVGGASASHQFSKTGTFQVSVVVTDALGRVATSTPLTVTVAAGPSVASPSPWSQVTNPSVFYPLLLVFALAAIAATYFVLRKRRKQEGNKDDATDSETKENPTKDEHTPIEEGA